MENTESQPLDLSTPADVTPVMDANAAPAPEPRPANEDSNIAALRKQYNLTKTELEGYKRRDEEARKAKLTEEQRIREEVEQMRQERDQLRMENMRRKVGSEYKLPESLMARLVGSDEDSLRADAEELASLLPKPKVGSVSNPVTSAGLNDVRKTFKEADIDRMPLKEFQRREAEIMQAYKEGRVTK